MRAWLSVWLRRVWARKLWLVAVLLYKVAEDRLLSALNATLDGLIGSEIASGVVRAIPWISWLAVPLTVMAILYQGYRDSRGGDGPYQRYGAEWAARDQDGHWNGIRERANELRADIKSAAATAGDRVTVKDLTTLKERVDALEVHVAGYEEVWGLQSFWDDRLRHDWERRPRSLAELPDPSWARPLWERVNYVIWWLYSHAPIAPPPRTPSTLADWGGWSDMGS